MKNLIFTLILAALFAFEVNAQTCDIKIEVLPEQFMYGKIKLSNEAVKNIQVAFKDEVMEVAMPLNGKNYLLTVLNENCQAYCKRDKRVRQLNSGDEKLVKNLIKIREEDIIAQIDDCSL